MINSLAVLNAETGKYEQRSVWETTRSDLGIYGVGVQLYFELLFWLACVFGVMAVLTFPLIIVSSLGEFAGMNVSGLAKITIANLGSCGKFDSLCLDISDYPYRPVFSYSPEKLLRDYTFGFGILDGFMMILLVLTITVFARYRIAAVELEQDKANITPKDFSIEVRNLPRHIENHH